MFSGTTIDDLISMVVKAEVSAKKQPEPAHE